MGLENKDKLMDRKIIDKLFPIVIKKRGISALNTLKFVIRLIKKVLAMSKKIFEKNKNKTKIVYVLVHISDINETITMKGITNNILIKSTMSLIVRNVPKYSELFFLLEY